MARKSWPLIIAGLALITLPLTGCGKNNAKAKGPQYRFTLSIFGTAGNPFFTKIISGAKEASKTLGCKVDVQFADNDAVKQNNILETAIANNADGVGVIINNDDAYDAIIKKARDKGVPVVSFNIDDSKGGNGNPRMAYIGQDLATAGYMITKRLVQDGGLKKDDFVVCPVEHPEAIYAVQRYAGVRKALDEAGIKSEVLNTGGVSLEDSLNKLTQYLLGHKDTDGIMAMGGMPMEVAPKAAEDAGLKIPSAGFDLTKQIARNILDGKSLATIDQQPFYQGYFTVLQLYYNKRYGLLPCSINTGGAIIDKTNAKLIMDLADSIR